MRGKNSWIIILASLQLLVSLALAWAIVWGYAVSQAPLGQFFHSVAASIGAVSNVVGRTAETVEARQGLIEQTGKMLVSTRVLLQELRVAAENQVKLVPQYAGNMRAASEVSGKLGGTLQSVSEGLLFSVPTSIEMDGMKPVVKMSRPLEKYAQDLKTQAQDIKAVSQTLLDISVTMGRDGKNLSAAFVTTNQDALKVVDEVERTLGRLNTQDLPKALEDLRATAENLRAISEKVDIASDIGKVLLAVGLLLALWCALNSVSTLMLANALPADPKRNKLNLSGNP
ncbi:hypothetical protein [Polaromonas naphthalenivorans]|uniref:Uncharacterized protein n=1 Tax=Polaromonas naphthalenivorans (strain CJ2) TaxID=365044 RepID=A1VWB0_POLNA|nr:hypothetical protein [Polaromonas naphthalenivorans]ABM39938.1 hypothetical protein Pnap_4874 [Polaromonas naphthalenivorans CJ2]